MINKSSIPNTGIALKGYPRSNTVASRNKNLSQEKAELASLIEMVVDDMIDQKCDVYTKKHTLDFREELSHLKQALVNLVQRIDTHASDMDHRLVRLEKQIQEARDLAVNVRNGIKDEEHARMDTIELKLQSLAIDRSTKQGKYIHIISCAFDVYHLLYYYLPSYHFLLDHIIDIISYFVFSHTRR